MAENPKNRPPQSQLTALTVGATIALLAGHDLMATQLPVACAAGTCGSNANALVSSGAATVQQTAQTLTVNQTTGKATLNWSSFNVSADASVIFQQPSSTAVALNRIYDANPSAIFGSLTANGQVYLINANGFLFGAGSTTNVAGLIASSLNITDNTFSTGILAPLLNSAPALEPFKNASGVAITNTGTVSVEAGAQLTATDGGRLLLAAPTVLNGGTLKADNGQVILAAGQKVYLQASTAPELRGLIVEVDQGGTAWNQLSGAISTRAGNISLVGLAVNQDGRLSATTTVSANGSIYLTGADGAKWDGTNLTAQAGHSVELGANSLVEILPEYSDPATAVDAQSQLQSLVSITGQNVLMKGGTIDAPSGLLNVTAAANPKVGPLSGANSQASIRIDAGTTIDLSGSTADVPVAANLVTLQLRSNELADDPQQRNGALQNQTVVIDARTGTTIANATSAIGAVGKNIAQRTESGGKATFISEGDVVFSAGATIDTSGGATNYLGGVMQTTKLIGADGKLYDIGTASPNLIYIGVLNPTYTQTYNKWGVKEVAPTPGLGHYEAGYVQGAAAGSVQFAAPRMSLAGALQASAINGLRQRSPATMVSGGTLTIGLPGGAAGNITPFIDFLSPEIAFAADPVPITLADTTPLAPGTLQVPTAYLQSDGFTNVRVYSNQGITLPAGQALQMLPGASLVLDAPRIDVNSSITALAGSLNLKNEATVSVQPPGSSRLGIGVADGVTFDVSGQWTNDSAALGLSGTGPLLQKAGSIQLQLTTLGSELVLGDNVALLANGGARVSASGAVSGGAGGSITLDASPTNAAVDFGQGVVLAGFGTGTASGGSFSLTAPRLLVSQGSGSEWTSAQRADDLAAPGAVLDLYAPLFSDHGFSAVNLTATGLAPSALAPDVLTIAAGTTVNVQTRSLELQPGYGSQASGGTVAGFSQVTTLPQVSRPPTSVTLNVVRKASNIGGIGGPDPAAAVIGNIDVQAGAAILADPRSSISLVSEGSITVNGTLRAEGGSIKAQILAPVSYDSATASAFETGYHPDQRIELGSAAVLDAGGTTLFTPNDRGLNLGQVLTGGSVALLAERGTVIADAGSLINVAGSQAALDIADAKAPGGYAHGVIASAAGSVQVLSAESISLLGNLEAHAGVGDTGSVAAGSLEIDMVRSSASVVGDPAVPHLPGSSLAIEIVGTTSGLLPSAPDSNVALLGVNELAQSGIDALTLRAGGTAATGSVLIATNTPLSLARQLFVDAPALAVASGIDANVSAPYIRLGNGITVGASATVPAPTAGTGTLAVNAQQLALVGNFALQDMANATLSATGDVRLGGTIQSSTGPLRGALRTAGDLTITGNRVYPDTFTSFSIASSSPGGTVTFGAAPSSAVPDKPLSAGGALSVTADNITVNGNVMAPFGTLSLTAANNLTMGSGGLLSVSGAGLDLPYGQTQAAGSQWIFRTATGTQTITDLPTKQVTLTAPNVALQSGSTVDLQGGGETYAYEWVPGTGGSKDALAAGVVPGLYAIVPGMSGGVEPYDPQETGSMVATATVHLTDSPGLPAGDYALLPARYALMPGAKLLQVQPGYTGVQGGQLGNLPDGTPVIAGYFSSVGTDLHLGNSLYTGFALYPGSQAQQLAAYSITTASKYFTAAALDAGLTAPATQADAGTLTLNVVKSINNSLDLHGSVLPFAGTGGRGALVNLSAPDLEISATGVGTGSSSIVVSADVLQSWNASRLTLGGISSVDGSGVVVAANSVTVDSGAQLSADQIVLVAQQVIDVKAGATLSSSSGKSDTALAILPADQSVVLTTSSGAAAPQAALLAVSDVALPIAQRPAGVIAGGGTVIIDSGATLSSRGAIALDAPGGVTVAGTIAGSGASWSLASNSVAFTGNASSTDTLQIGDNLLVGLAQAGALRIGSGSSIDLLTPIELGVTAPGAVPTLKSLTFVGANLNNGAAGDTLLGAHTLSLGGLAGTVGSAPDPGSGTLALIADTLYLGPGTLGVGGFAQTHAQVAGAVVGTGVGGLIVGGDLVLNAAQITATADSQTQISAPSGTLQIGVASASQAALPRLLGGNLALSANDIEDAGAIAVSGGLVSLSATHSLHLASTASITTAGTTAHVLDQAASSPGGWITLNAGGNINADAGATLDVAGAGAAPAGTLNITGGGTVTTAATFTAGTNVSGGGTFNLDAGQLTGGLDALVGSLSNAGFDNSVAVRVRSGDLTLANGASLSSRRISLTADSGAIDIAGTLSAPSAGLRGFIGLYGGTSVTLESTGQLHADGAGTSGRGGQIEVSSTCATCFVAFKSGSLITTSGITQMGGLLVRAPALGNSDVAINAGSQGIGADVGGVGQVIIEPVITFDETAATMGTGLGNDVAAVANFLTAAGSGIAARLTGAAPTLVAGGLEIHDTSASDTLVLPAIDLYPWSQQGQVIDLTVRAAGGLTIAGNISDGYTTDVDLTGLTILGTTPSGSLRFVAGADLASANPLAVQADSTADLTVGSPEAQGSAPAVVRTGTGALDLVAARDVVFRTGSSAYTAGISAVPFAYYPLAGGDRLMNFASRGGNVGVTAGRDVVGSILNGASRDYTVTSWQIRAGGPQNAAQYGVDLDAFNWNTGALGGGDLNVTAGRDALNLSAAVADSLVSAAVDPSGTLTRYGTGGGLGFTTGRDIGSAQVYVADGVGTLTAGGGLTSARTSFFLHTPVGSSFALGDSQMSVWSRQSAQIDVIYNPSVVGETGVGLSGRYFTYGADSSFNVTSVDGTVTLDPSSSDQLSTLLGQNGFGNGAASLQALPSSLAAQALQGDINVSASRLILYPSSTGQLQLFAGRDIVGNNSSLAMSDSLAAVVPTATNPGITGAIGPGTVIGLQFFGGVIHAGDTAPALVTAGRDLNGLNLSLPKSSRIGAVRDIRNLGFQGQNANAGDLTIVSAGRDIRYSGSTGNLGLGGPGRFDVLAARNINLGVSGGITTVGNLSNANLPSATGADLTVMAGMGAAGPDYAGFFQAIVAPSTTYQAELVTYVQAQTGQSGLTYAQAASAFAGFTTDLQRPFIDKVYFKELVLSGREANSGSGAGFTRGYAAIDALFPGSRTAIATGPNPYAGSLTLTSSQIYSLSGGDISIFTPGGGIDVGLANPPASVAPKSPSKLGIVAQGTGNVSIYSMSDVNVNKSRVFTLGGGNILIWSDEGSIDAGNGSKSSLSVPPPGVLVNVDGTITLNFAGSLAAGSGIRTIQTNHNVAAGSVDLIAPEGTVNAGDAGIGSAGDLNIAASHVLGVDNIQFGGNSAGVPSDIGGLGASLSGLSNVASSATSSASSSVEGGNDGKSGAPLSQAALTWLEVFVLGLGEDNCKPDDMDCMRRQKKQ